MMEEQRTNEHQGVGGLNSGEKSLWSGPNRWERSDPRPEEIRTRQAESSKRVPKGDDEGMWNSNCDTQHPVGAGRGTGDGATRLTALRALRKGNIGIGVLQEKNSPEAFTCDGARVKRYGKHRKRVDTKGGSPSFGGTRRDGGLREYGILDQTW